MKKEEIQIAEIECSTCEKIIAYVQVIPGIALAHGEAWCQDCFRVGY